jgi:transcriptional regulator with XRE-family HTH domain
MNNVGEKIRGIRTLKGLSQQNMADVLGLSLPTYAEIERGKKDVTISRLEAIAKELGVTLNDILNFNERVANFFDQCNSVIAGVNNGGQTANNYDARELKHQNEKLQLELRLLQAEKEKAEMEARYLKEKYEKVDNNNMFAKYCD